MLPGDDENGKSQRRERRRITDQVSMQQGDSILIAEPLSASPYIAGPAYWAIIARHLPPLRWRAILSVLGERAKYCWRESLSPRCCSMVGYVVTARNAVPATILSLLLPKRDLRFPPSCHPTSSLVWDTQSKFENRRFSLSPPEGKISLASYLLSGDLLTK